MSLLRHILAVRDEIKHNLTKLSFSDVRPGYALFTDAGSIPSCRPTPTKLGATIHYPIVL